MKITPHKLQKITVLLVIVCFEIAITQCKTSTPAKATKVVNPFDPQQTDVALAQTHWPSVTAAQLVQGYNIYATKCNDCHDMKNLVEFSMSEWPDLMQKMGRKAKLDSNQYNLVWHYIVSRREALVSAKK